MTLDPQLALESLDRFVADSIVTGSSEILARVLEDLTANAADQGLGLLHVNTRVLYTPCQPYMRSAWKGKLTAMSDEHQVISTDKLQWHTSAQLMRKHFQNQGEELRAKGTPTPKPNSSLHWPLHTTSGIKAHALDDTHRPYLDTETLQCPSQCLAWHTDKCFIQAPLLSNRISVIHGSRINYETICCPQFCTYSYQILCHVGGTSPPTWHKIW